MHTNIATPRLLHLGGDFRARPLSKRWQTGRTGASRNPFIPGAFEAGRLFKMKARGNPSGPEATKASPTGRIYGSNCAHGPLPSKSEMLANRRSPYMGDGPVPGAVLASAGRPWPGRGRGARQDLDDLAPDRGAVEEQRRPRGQQPPDCCPCPSIVVSPVEAGAGLALLADLGLGGDARCQLDLELGLGAAGGNALLDLKERRCRKYTCRHLPSCRRRRCQKCRTCRCPGFPGRCQSVHRRRSGAPGSGSPERGGAGVHPIPHKSRAPARSVQAAHRKSGGPVAGGRGGKRAYRA